MPNLPRIAVLRAQSSGYLQPDYSLGYNYQKAVRLTLELAHRALAVRWPKYHPMWGLSIEECPKRERRKAIVADETFVKRLEDYRQQIEVANLLQLAQAADDNAKYYRAEAAKLQAKKA